MDLIKRNNTQKIKNLTPSACLSSIASMLKRLQFVLDCVKSFITFNFRFRIASYFADFVELHFGLSKMHSTAHNTFNLERSMKSKVFWKYSSHVIYEEACCAQGKVSQIECYFIVSILN